MSSDVTPSSRLMRIETDRLLLRSLRPEDVEPEVSLRTDPRVTEFMGGPRDAEMVRRVLQEELDAPPVDLLGQWPVVDKLSGEFVGDCGLISKDIDGHSEVELVYVLSVHAWGRGYATEIGSALLRFAVEELGQVRIVSLIDQDNVASKRVAEKLGMFREATIKRPDGIERELWVTAGGGV